MSDPVDALEERLSRPTPHAEAGLAGVGGDVVVLGAGGKMGPTLARMALRARGEHGRVIAVARWTEPATRARLEAAGVHTLAADLLDPSAVRALPDAGAVLFLAGTKFGTAADPNGTWAVNAWLPGLVAERYCGVPTVVFSSGNVYPLMTLAGRGADERTEPAPVGEYAWSVLARERVYAHRGARHGTPLVILRLNYANEPRYGVLVDIALRVRDGRPIDIATGHVNVIWQRDANAIALACLPLAAAPPRVLNVAGPEPVAVRAIAEALGARLGRQPVLVGEPQGCALLSDATEAWTRFGPPTLTLHEQIDEVAAWVRAGLPRLEKPTHYETRDGVY